MQKKVDVSVIICTYNRCESLKQTLTGLASQKVPKKLKWELIVVDGNSNDNTKEIILDFKDKLPIRFEVEKQPGLSVARNKGAKIAKGEYICYMDDDETPKEDWIFETYKAIKRYNADCIGGKILLHLPKQLPNWFSDNLLRALSLVDLGNSVMKIENTDQMIYGGNFAFTKKIFNKVGAFNSSLGRKKGSVLGGEDVDFVMRIIQLGGKVLYTPKSIVDHQLGPERLKKSYFRRIFYNLGKLQGKDLSNFFQTFKWMIAFRVKGDVKRAFVKELDLFMMFGSLFK